MKILVVQDWLRSGGTERQSVLLANAFAATGHDSTLLTFRPGGPLAPTVANNVHRVALQRFDTGLDWFCPGLASFIEKNPPDITLCMGRMANCMGHVVRNVLVDRFPHARVIGTMRTGKPLPWLFRKSLRVAAHVVANSRDARETLVREYGLPADKISVIYNSLVFPEVGGGDSRTALRTKHGAGAKTTVLLCVAMFRPEKNQRELVEIVAGLPPEADWQLWLAGEGPARAACEELVRTTGLTARVKFLGFWREPAALYGAADVAVHASWSEALSNFLIEAQAHGLPAVAYAAQGIAECFVPAETGWVIPRDDRDAFRTRVLELVGESSGDRTRRAEAARRYARETFDPRRQVDTYLSLFERLASCPQP